MLEKTLPWCSVINQDKYYYDEDSYHHVRSPNGTFINWEVLSAFNMKKMKEDISVVSQNLLKGTPLRECNTITYPGFKSIRTRLSPVLIIEGKSVFINKMVKIHSNDDRNCYLQRSRYCQLV